MFRIGVAEDDLAFRQTISEYIERYKKEKKCRYPGVIFSGWKGACIQI